MESVHWESLRSMFESVCDLPPSQWRAELERISEDPALIEEAMAMLQARTASFEHALGPLRDLMAALPDAELTAGDQVGPWRLVERLASGGMGTVFVAERADDLFRQRVAIKLLRSRLADPVIAQRLIVERQILADLYHPNIARLYDGGTTPAGQPYLVMEYIDGMPLDEYCRTHALGLQQRLILFQRICGAVQAAHRRLVVHCDLKPSNVLVRSDGQPVLLDFGIARWQEQGDDDRGAEGFCTPAYAAPELRGNGAVSTASDVFSLGILLAELVACGSIPRSLSDPFAPLPLPSTWAAADCPWKYRLKGDLDAIVLRACAIESTQRYATVEALANDIHAYRSHHPVAARTPTLVYRTGRWLRRHWRENLAAAVALAALLGFMGRLSEERTRAEQEAEAARQVSDFLVEAFSTDAGGRSSGSGEVSAREILDRGVVRVESEWKDSPVMLARLRSVLGSAYKSLGMPKQAEPLLIKAAQGYLDERVARPLDAADALSELTVLMSNQFRADEAVETARRVIELRESHGARRETLADSYLVLGLAQLRKADHGQARLSLEKALAISRERYGTSSMKAAAVLHNLGLLHREMGDNAGSERYFKQALAIRRDVDAHSAAVQSSQQGLAVTLGVQGRHAEATALLRDNLGLASALYGTDSTRTASAHMRLAVALKDLGQYRRARDEAARALDIYARASGEDSLEYSQALGVNADVEAASGNWVVAEQRWRRAWAIRRGQLPVDDRAVLRAQDRLATALMQLDRMQEAEAMFQRTWPLWRKNHGANNSSPEWAEVVLSRWEWSVRQGRPATDEPLPEVGDQPAIELRRRVLMAELASWRKDAKASSQAWQDVVAVSTRQAGEASAATAQWRVRYAEALFAAGDMEAATRQLVEAETALRRELVAGAEPIRRLDALKAALASR